MSSSALSIQHASASAIIAVISRNCGPPFHHSRPPEHPTVTRSPVTITAPSRHLKPCHHHSPFALPEAPSTPNPLPSRHHQSPQSIYRHHHNLPSSPLPPVTTTAPSPPQPPVTASAPSRHRHSPLPSPPQPPPVTATALPQPSSATARLSNRPRPKSISRGRASPTGKHSCDRPGALGTAGP